MDKLIHNLYLFKGLKEADLNAIRAIASLQSYRAGDKIFEQGDPAEVFYVIQHGSVSIKQTTGETTLEVAVLGTGSHFGEMSFLDGERRSATAEAASDSDIIAISYASLHALLDMQPHISIHVHRELARFLCSRLRLTTMDLNYAKSHNISYF